jgi:hypothetical protein
MGSCPIFTYQWIFYRLITDGGPELGAVSGQSSWPENLHYIGINMKNSSEIDESLQRWADCKFASGSNFIPLSCSSLPLRLPIRRAPDLRGLGLCGSGRAH